MNKLLLGAFLSLFFSCVSVNGSLDLRYETVSSVEKNCSKLIGRTVNLEAIYKCWDCPFYCKTPPPAITLTDTCIVDSSSCIYLKGTGKLDPIMDRGKKYLFKAVVKKSKKGVCYLEVLSVDELR